MVDFTIKFKDMRAKEKANELVDKYRTIIRKADLYEYLLSEDEIFLAKESALITVDELIIQNGELYLNGLDGVYYTEKNNFLFEVKQEILKLL